MAIASGDSAPREPEPESEREDDAEERGGHEHAAEPAVRGVVPGTDALRQLQRRAEQVDNPRRHVQVCQPRMRDVPALEVLWLRLRAGDQERASVAIRSP